MRLTRRPAVDPRWAPRARRARTLIADRPHSAPLLRFYLALLELQTAVCAPLDAARWLPAVAAPDAAGTPRLRLERLPGPELSAGFAAFCRQMPDSAPAPVARAAQALAGAGAQTRSDLLLALLTGAEVDAAAASLGCAPAALAFLPRGFLSPLVEALSLLAPADGAPRSPCCPRCGWPPQVSRLADEPDTQGIRHLICSFCAAPWTFPRSSCPACEASGEDGLDLHVDEELSQVRVEACRTCRRYLKSVDLRIVGVAEPLVEDLATPELDLWAVEQGLEKITPNLLGL